MMSPFRWLNDQAAALQIRTRRTPVLGKLFGNRWISTAITYAVPLALLAALAWLVWGGVERIILGNERVVQVTQGIKDNPPTRESKYCRRLFGYGQEYPGCYSAERTGYAQFARAWELGKDLGTVREQMIACYLDGKRVEGMSWAAAAHCAEADTLPPGTTQGN